MPHSISQNGSAQKLVELLRAQVDHYRQAEALEEQLALFISRNDFEGVSSNSREKTELMQKIGLTDSELSPLLAGFLREDGRFADPAAEELRRAAVDILESIQERESDNLDALEKNRTGMLKGFRHSRQARDAARGYKRSTSIYRSKFDTKR